jgi:hypothetical protein
MHKYIAAIGRELDAIAVFGSTNPRYNNPEQYAKAKQRKSILASRLSNMAYCERFADCNS